MKQIKLVLVVMLLWMGTTTVNAQKIAHINVQQIMTEMPEFKQGQAQLKKLYATYEKEFKDMQEGYRTKLEKAQRESKTVSETENQKRANELMELERTIKQQQQVIQQEAAKKEAELIQPIQKKLLKAINDVAKEKGYDYVLDSSGPSSLIVANGPDLYNDVKAKLGF